MITHKELEVLSPCESGLQWASQYSTLHEAWEKCQRSDWMWWLLRKLNKCPKELSIQYSCWCADSVEHLKSASYSSSYASSYAADASYASADYAAAHAADAANAAAATYAAAATSYATSYATFYADARSKQADYLHSIVPNPFAL